MSKIKSTVFFPHLRNICFVRKISHKEMGPSLEIQYEMQLEAMQRRMRKMRKEERKKIIYKYVCISSICQTIYICTYVEGKQVSSYPASSTVWACNFCASFLGCILGSSAQAARYIPEILEIKMHMHLGICGVVHANAASSPLLWFGHHSCN